MLDEAGPHELPNRRPTDFSTWTQPTLAKLAQELKERNIVLEQQVKDLLNGFRKEWIKNE